MDRDESENTDVVARLKPTVIAGRGAPSNPAGRFEKLADADDIYSTPDPDEEPDTRQVKTTIYRDTSKTIVSSNNSPDLGMDASVNPYRGCEHGCIYCFARPYHEYLGLSAGLDFETKIFVKPDAPELLRAKLESKSWEPQIVTLSGVTDCYQPIERKLQVTRGCFKVLSEYKNPGTIITKNYLVTRDIDIFKEMAEYRGISVNMSITTLDADLARKMEPRASRPSLRLKAVELLTKAGIPVNVMVAPVIPGLTDHEIPAILKNVANAGATSAAYTMVRLPYGVKDLFQGWLDEHFPDRKDKILNRIRESRGGLLNDARFGSRLRGEGFYADEIAQIFSLSKKRYGLTKGFPALSAASFRRPPRPTGDVRQGSLF